VLFQFSVYFFFPVACMLASDFIKVKWRIVEKYLPEFYVQFQFWPRNSYILGKNINSSCILSLAFSFLNSIISI
jgi:hypothetical protein